MPRPKFRETGRELFLPAEIEMVGARKEFDGRLDPAGHLQQSCYVTVGILIAGEDQTNLSGKVGKIEIHQIDGRGNEYPAAQERPAPQDLHIHPGPEGIAGQKDLPDAFLLQDACRRQDILLFPQPLIIAPLTAADTPEIETQRGVSLMEESLHKRFHHIVLQAAAHERMGMGDDHAPPGPGRRIITLQLEGPARKKDTFLFHLLTCMGFPS